MELDFGEIGNVQYLLSSGPLGTLFMPSAKNLVSVQPKIGPNKTVRLKMLQAKWAKIKHFPRFFCSAPKEKRERIHSITSTPHHKPNQMKLFFDVPHDLHILPNIGPTQRHSCQLNWLEIEHHILVIHRTELLRTILIAYSREYNRKTTYY